MICQVSGDRRTATDGVAAALDDIDVVLLVVALVLVLFLACLLVLLLALADDFC